VTAVKVPSPVALTRRRCRAAWATPGAAGPGALGEGIQRAAAAELHVNKQRAARGHLRGGGRLRPERDHRAGAGQVGDGAGLGQVDGGAADRAARSLSWPMRAIRLRSETPMSAARMFPVCLRPWTCREHHRHP